MTNLLPDNNGELYFVCLLVLLVILSGCARLPYGPAITGDERSKLIGDFARFAAVTAECANSFDGEILVNWEHPVNSISFSGYFQTRLPSSLRFSVLNPLGQPIYAVASNGTTFQSVDTAKRVFTAGTLRSYAMLNDIPLTFLTGPWGAWLSARPTIFSVLEVHDDKDKRGIWYSVEDTDRENPAKELLLLDRSASRMLERVISGKGGKTEATISYGNWQRLGSCEQPLEITITGLAYGAAARLELSDVQVVAGTTDNTFKITPPAGYKQRLLP